MSGHKKGDTCYFVPRTQLPLARSVEAYCRLLLPDLAKWRREAKSPQGDKSTCCDKFLNEILPYFVKVLVQDGIYLVDEFPEHPISHLLKVSFYYGDYCVSNNLF
jgi:hypothetical protein